VDDDIGLRHLKVLSLLLEVGSLTQAADILGVSQSSVSKMLARLRSHFGDPLLVRVGLAMHPTPKATALVEPLRALLAASEALRAGTHAFVPDTSTREFRVLVTDVGMIQLVPGLVRRLQKEGPSLRLRALPLDSRAFETRLEGGEADVVLGAFPGAAGSLRRQHLYNDGYLSVVRKDHPRLDQMRTPEGFWAERHVAVASSNTGHAAHQRLERLISARLDADHIQMSVPSFVAAAFVASRADAIATLPGKLAEILAEDLKLAAFAPPIETPPIEIDQLWHERVDQDAGHRWFRSLIFDEFGRVS